MQTSITISRITLAYDATGFRGGDIQRRATITDDAGKVIHESDLPLEAIAGTVQQGADLAPIIGQAAADAITAGAAALDRERVALERIAALEAQIAAVEPGSPSQIHA